MIIEEEFVEFSGDGADCLSLADDDDMDPMASQQPAPRPSNPADPRLRYRGLIRRSSSADPPVDADSWRQLRLIAAAAAEQNSLAQLATVDRRDKQSAEADERAPADRLRQPASCSVSIDTEDCSSCVKRAAIRRKQRGGGQRGRATSQLFVGQQHPCYILQQHHQQLPTPCQGPATFIPVPGALTITPDSQQSFSLFGSGLVPTSSGCGNTTATVNLTTASPSVSPAVRGQSASAMYLNLQPPTPDILSHHQAAPLSPSLHSPCQRLHRRDPLYLERATGGPEEQVTNALSSGGGGSRQRTGSIRKTAPSHGDDGDAEPRKEEETATEQKEDGNREQNNGQETENNHESGVDADDLDA